MADKPQGLTSDRIGTVETPIGASTMSDAGAPTRLTGAMTSTPAVIDGGITQGSVGL